MKALYTFPPSVGLLVDSGQPSIVIMLFRRLAGGQILYLDPRHTRATIPLRLL